MMRGIVMTLTVSLILLGVLSYLFFVAQGGIERTRSATDQLSAERVYHYWRAVSANLKGILNVSATRINDTAVFNDSLPATRDIDKMLGVYQMFVESYFEDPTISIRFEDSEGHEIILNQSESAIYIKPMNIKYEWDDYGKNQLFIKAPPENFSFIERIDMNLKVTPTIKDLSSIKWSPLKQCGQQTTHCLHYRATVTDGNKTWVSSEQYFDVDFSSSVKIGLTGEPSSDFFVRITVGQLDNVVNVDMLNANVTADTAIKLNTSEFYINSLAQINVTAPFGQKVE